MTTKNERPVLLGQSKKWISASRWLCNEPRRLSLAGHLWYFAARPCGYFPQEGRCSAEVHAGNHHVVHLSLLCGPPLEFTQRRRRNKIPKFSFSSSKTKFITFELRCSLRLIIKCCGSRIEKSARARFQLSDGHNGEQLGGSSGQIGCKIRFFHPLRAGDSHA